MTPHSMFHPAPDLGEELCTTSTIALKEQKTMRARCRANLNVLSDLTHLDLLAKVKVEPVLMNESEGPHHYRSIIVVVLIVKMIHLQESFPSIRILLPSGRWATVRIRTGYRWTFRTGKVDLARRCKADGCFSNKRHSRHLTL
jgi:hypothetical protein